MIYAHVLAALLTDTPADPKPIEVHRQRVQEATRDPRWLSVIYSAEVCWYERDRAASYEAIAKERRYGKIGGVVDAGAIYRLQADIRRADEQIPRIRAKAKAAGAALQSCKDRLVRVLGACLAPFLGGELAVSVETCQQKPIPHLEEVARALVANE